MTSRLWDVVVIGGGPAGLSAALNAKLEGFSTLLIERPSGWGGRAAQSARIDNVLALGGLSGPELLGRACAQVREAGVAILEGDVEHLTAAQIRMREAAPLYARTTIVATGMKWNRLNVPGLPEAELVGLARYGCQVADGPVCAGKTVAIIGGANSAGINALHFANCGAHVTLLVRGAGFSSGMSAYLREQLEAHPRVDIQLETELRAVSLVDDDTYLRLFISNAPHFYVEKLFLFPDAVPATDFAECRKDEKGFLVAPEWATSSPSIFACGDCRSGSIKRIATAIGEGAAVVLKVKRYLEAEGRCAVCAA